MKKTNLIRITKEGQKRIDTLLNSFMVDSYHKTLLRAIKDRIPKKNVSKSDCDIFKTVSDQYRSVV